MRVNGERYRWLAASVAAIFALGAIIAAFLWPAIFDTVLASQIVLKPGSRSYKNWVEADVPLSFKVYLFNWTNADKFLEEKPNFEERGPYTFLEERRRVNITMNDNGTISYRTFRAYKFDAAASNGSLDDNITTLNAVAASAVYRYRTEGFIKQKMLEMALTVFGQHFSISKTAGQLLFDGYDDPLLDMAKTMPPSTMGGAPVIDKFGWFFTRNNSLDTDGYMQVSAGSSRELPGQILQWNDERRLPFYSGSCAEVSGTAGEFFPRTLSPASRPRVFVPELCRTVSLSYSHSDTLHSINYLHYEMARDSFDTVNSCYCSPACQWSGVMNVSSCRFGSPSIISLPHFLHGDPTLRDLVTGMEPREDKHSFYFGLEPKLGIPIDVAGRFQLNMFVEANPNIGLYANVPTMLFPILWIEQHVVIDEKIADELKFVRVILDWGAVFCSGIALFLAAIIALATCTTICLRKPKYLPPQEILSEKPKDEVELKLNPM